MKKISYNQNGFSLVEVLVAISLLLMVIVGPMQILSRANNSSAFANEQVTAWFLAQEGLELAQQGRDGFLLQYFNGAITDPWSRFKSGALYRPCFSATGCGLVTNNDGSPAVVDCAVNSCQLFINYSSDTSIGRATYQHVAAGNTATPFTRVIYMKETGADREIAATSTVTWRTGSLITGQKVETTTYLFNIYGTQ